MLTNIGGEPVDPARDRPGFALRTLLGATLAGTSSVALVLWGVRALVDQAPASDRPVVTGPAFWLLVGGTMAAMLLAAALAWWRLAPLSATWRRGAFSMISGLGTVTAAIAATPIQQFYGRRGLLIMALATGVLGAIALRPTRRDDA
jgi:hypothetical protein